MWEQEPFEEHAVSHMVIFRSTEGKAGYHQAEALDDAVRFVERLRNGEGVEQAHIFRLEEVPFEFRPYYRVEVGAGTLAAAAGPPAVSTGPGSESPPPEDEAVSEDEAIPPAPVTEETEPAPSPSPFGPLPVEQHETVQPYTVEEYVSASNGGRRGLFGR